ncbi:MAG: hypothetical protein H0V70_21660 [Ktedonobacteraceae bacterium]|nr:hypothetical protein [Ktedonobacteraceae bacterium]
MRQIQQSLILWSALLALVLLAGCGSKSSTNAAGLAVLQKQEEEHQEQSFAVLLLRLDGHSEQFCDECCLSQTVSFAHSLHLPFPHHVYCFISL